MCLRCADPLTEGFGERFFQLPNARNDGPCLRNDAQWFCRG
jgi:hypothetical protein